MLYRRCTCISVHPARPPLGPAATLISRLQRSCADVRRNLPGKQAARRDKSRRDTLRVYLHNSQRPTWRLSHKCRFSKARTLPRRCAASTLRRISVPATRRNVYLFIQHTAAFLLTSPRRDLARERILSPPQNKYTIHFFIVSPSRSTRRSSRNVSLA